MGAVTLRPGVDVEQTPSLNQAGISQSQIIRFKNGLIQPMGGWMSYGTTIPSTVRDLHAWQDIAHLDHLSAAGTANVVIISSGPSKDITPQTFTTNPAPNFTTTASSFAITVADPNSGPSLYNTVFFNTPISIDGLLLNGAYQITSVLSTGSYIIQSSVPAVAGVSNSGVTPTFQTSANSPIVTVIEPYNNVQSIIGLSQAFYAPTTVGGLTIKGAYSVTKIVNPSSTFTITTPSQATSTASAAMNGGNAQLVYYVVGGPPGVGIPFGAGAFSSNPFGGLGGSFSGAAGMPITARDYTQDNWGEILLFCPQDGPIYIWAPDTGLAIGEVVTTAPFFNGGIFISMPQQILVAWRSVLSTGVQDNLVVRWSDALNYTNWTVSNQTQAGSFHIPTGSIIMGGLQAPNYGVIWTDIDCWLMQFVGGDIVFGFTRVGTGCGLIGSHGAGVLAGTVYWCGTNNFFTITPSGVQPIPCTVWDYIFQNLNTTYAWKIRCAPNATFNEIAWFFPSTGAIENDSYVKLNIIDNTWDYGKLVRTAWTDLSVVGNPIGADTGGVLWQHEQGEMTPGTGVPSFQSGWWSLTEGNDLAFVDYVIPDFKYGLFAEPTDAQISVTFFSADYPNDTPRMYGPYTVTPATEYISPRLRGRLMSIQVKSNNQEFWRLGKVRFRFALSGRR
jgi:hypothetical protein